MKQWIIALIITIVVFAVLQFTSKVNDEKGEGDKSMLNQVATFFAILVISMAGCYWFTSSSTDTTGTNIFGDVGNIESEMLKTIKEEISVGLPPF